MIKVDMTIRSVSLEMDTKVTVLLPEDRHKTVDTRGKKYPVLYILHGFKEDNSSWLHLSDIMLDTRDLDLIVVMPSGLNSSYTNAKYGWNYYDWISSELPTKMKNLFPISDKREDTFIMGESMGGCGTLQIALSKPEVYGKAVCLSGCATKYGRFTDKQHYGLFGDEADWENSPANCFASIEKLKSLPAEQLPELTFYCGTEDGIYPACVETYQYMLKELPDMKISAEFWHGQHNFFFWNEAIPKALKQFGFTIEENSVI